MSKDEFVLHEWQKDKLDELVRITREERIAKESVEQGLVQGIAQGIKQGLEQGITQKNTEIVTNMLKKNMDINLISEITGLTKKEIMKIKKSL